MPDPPRETRAKPREPGSPRVREVVRCMAETLGAPVVYAVVEGKALKTLAVAPEGQKAPASLDPADHPAIAKSLKRGEPIILDVDVSSAYGASQALFIPWTDDEGTSGACVLVGAGRGTHSPARLKYVAEIVPERMRTIGEIVRLERRLAELEQAASAFRALIEATSDAVNVIDLDGRVRVWNGASETLYGYKAREVMGQVLPHIPPSERPRAIARLRSIASLVAPQEREITGVRKDGSLFGAVVTAVPLCDAEGLPVGVLAVIRRVDTDTRLEQMQGDFLALVSQELKNPLTAILGFAQLLSRPGIRDDPRKRARTVRALESRAQEMSAVIDDLLLASRVDRSGLVLRRAPTDLATLVTETVSSFEQSQPRHRFVIDADTRMPAAYVDARRIGQAVTNLLANAVRQSPRSEEVRVKVVRDQGFASISVTDRGDGIFAGDLERVFDRFYKPRDAKGDRGMGLGLYLVRTIVEEHGGTVAVVSQPDKGSTFTMRVPLAVS